MIDIYVGDALERLRQLAENSAHCCVTSPPYWGQRDYKTGRWEGGDPECDHPSLRKLRGHMNGIQATNKGSADGQAVNVCRQCGARRIDQQLGIEDTIEVYLFKLVTVFHELRRVLRPEGLLWLNMGDTYASGKGTMLNPGGGETSIQKQRVPEGIYPLDRGNISTLKRSGLKQKDLIGLPWRLALALQQPYLRCRGCDQVAHRMTWGRFPSGRLICPGCNKLKGWVIETPGWWLRNNVIWFKTNPMPSSARDRCVVAHEDVFILSPSKNYYFDQFAIMELPDSGPSDIKKMEQQLPRITTKSELADDWYAVNPKSRIGQVRGVGAPNLRNPRDVWEIPTYGYKGIHFATFPPELARRCIAAGSSERGACPACGAPWTRIVKRRGGTTGTTWHDHSTDEIDGNRPDNRTAKNAWENGDYTVESVGWQPGCDCYEYIKKKKVSVGDQRGMKPPAPVPCTVIDPFAGACTTALAADRLGRNAIMIELSAEYAEDGRQRIEKDAGMFAEVNIIPEGEINETHTRGQRQSTGVAGRQAVVTDQ